MLLENKTLGRSGDEAEKILDALSHAEVRPARRQAGRSHGRGQRGRFTQEAACAPAGETAQLWPGDK